MSTLPRVGIRPRGRYVNIDADDTEIGYLTVTPNGKIDRVWAYDLSGRWLVDPSTTAIEPWSTQPSRHWAAGRKTCALRPRTAVVAIRLRQRGLAIEQVAGQEGEARTMAGRERIEAVKRTRARQARVEVSAQRVAKAQRRVDLAAIRCQRAIDAADAKLNEIEGSYCHEVNALVDACRSASYAAEVQPFL
jgi:hypothetical protein